MPRVARRRSPETPHRYKDICKEIGNLNLSQVARLSGKGFTLIYGEPKYQNLLPQLLEKIRAA
ncbi:hypothetical protein GC105_16205 [Alkalibaculum sp. M08DMB]|uniref:Uncharacterized protein n=1 Tax=Alkalibaculum sporogenes TaxID=2655001 RepID=A0A6A7KCQ4_9FIRM|nr:hypothetical protein [Alkalibaculum sporogenes]MPW27309.1 hypothetical protein [Alkalibaculum sporogenes]